MKVKEGLDMFVERKGAEFLSELHEKVVKEHVIKNNLKQVLQENMDNNQLPYLFYDFLNPLDFLEKVKIEGAELKENNLYKIIGSIYLNYEGQKYRYSKVNSAAVYRHCEPVNSKQDFFPKEVFKLLDKIGEEVMHLVLLQYHQEQLDTEVKTLYTYRTNGYGVLLKDGTEIEYLYGRYGKIYSPKDVS